MTPRELVERLVKVDMAEIAVTLYDKHQDQFVSRVKGQLWDGKKPDGSNITPSYLDDPYFKTRRQAEAYAAWKQKITNNPKRDKYAPNLYINGYFYSTIAMRISPRPTIDAQWSEVASKYRDAMGLSSQNKQALITDPVGPDLRAIITQITGLSFS